MPAPPCGAGEEQRGGEAVLTRRIIACLDVRDGRVVKGVQFQRLRDSGDPVERALEYQRQGADEIVLLDVSATPDRRATCVDVVAAVRRSLSIPLTVGGGVQTVADAEALLRAGADKVGVNSAAVARPELLRELAQRFGSQCVVLAIDAQRSTSLVANRPPLRASQAADSRRPEWRIVVRSGRERIELDAVAWARFGAGLGAGEILLTSWDRDGTAAGYDLDLLRAVCAAVGLPVVASGGGAGSEHLAQAYAAGASAALVASILHDGVTTVGALKNTLRGRGLRLRP